MSKSPTNAEFLAAIRAPFDRMALPQAAAQWICQFPNFSEQWKGRVYKPIENIEHSEWDGYFCISLLHHHKGNIQRKKDNFYALPCIVLDDVGTKADVPSLPPSWILQTSPGNYQYGYILESPITDVLEADRIIKAIINAGYCDKGASGPTTRYMRLPVGSNCKPEHIKANGGKPWKHIVDLWKPDRLFHIDELIEKLGLKLDAETETKSPTVESQDFKEDTAFENFTSLLREKVPDSELIADIISAESYYNSLLILTARYTVRGMSRDNIIQTVKGFLLGNGDTSDRAKDRLKLIPSMVDGALKKFKKETKKFKILTASEFTQGPLPEWLIKKILPSKGLAMVFGESGAGKSFFIVDMLAAIGRGISWQNYKTKKAKVLYVPAEGVSGARNRIKAYCKNYDLSMDDIGIHFLEGEGLNIYNEDTEPLIETIQEYGGIEVIVFDTLAQISAGADENKGEHMGLIMARCQEIAKKLNALVILIHHSGKDASRGSRGWSGLKAPLDTEIFVSEEGNTRVATITKQKDGQAGLTFAFELVPVVLGQDNDGEDIESCVVRYVQAPNKAMRNYKKLSKWQKFVFEAAKDLCGVFDNPVSICMILDKASKALPFDVKSGKRDSRRDSAKRALDDLIGMGTLFCADDKITLSQSRDLSQSDDCEKAA